MADEKLVPTEALNYIKNKKLQPSFSYKDVWNEEHSTAFTVAKAMQVDIVEDFKKAIENALAEGQDYRQFEKNIIPTLQAKGWWGKKEMKDPLTGKMVNAQLGNSRRLKTIYNTNMRSAYQKGMYERTMASSLPYLMYLVGPSENHRKEHLAWDGLILPKTDPWWDNHFPVKEYGCKCYTVAVSEARKKRYETQGIPVAATSPDAPTEYVKPQTKAPKERYYTYVNERKGIIEQVPVGVDPGFNAPISLNRQANVIDGVTVKIRDKAPEQFDDIMKTIYTSQITQQAHVDFVEKSLLKKVNETTGKIEANPSATEAVGFFDLKVQDFLKKNNLTSGQHSIIMLQQKLISSKKFSERHAKVGNAPSKDDWLKLVDYLLDADVYFDDKSLIYLYKKSESVYVKIAVAPETTVSRKGTSLFLPKVDTMYLLTIDSESDSGIDEYNRITKMEKIR